MSSRVGLWLVAVLFAVGPARAYDQAGHYYTVRAGVSMIKPALDATQARVIAFCAQLPDHAIELDAQRVYRNIRKDSLGDLDDWLRKDIVGDDAIALKRMVTVQQLLHGLTGGTVEAVDSVATNTVVALRAQAGADPGNYGTWCALGFALHLYGDSQAHRVMDGKDNNPEKMYATGKGHALDLTYPDRPLCALFKHSWFNPWGCEVARPDRRGRFENWEKYLKAALAKLALNATVDPAPIDLVAAQILEKGRDASTFNNWREAEMRTALVAGDVDRFPGEFLDKLGSGKTCQAVLDLARQGNGPLPAETNVPAWTCRAAWNTYYDVVKAEFEKNSAARQKLNPDYEKIYTANVWTGEDQK